MNKSGNFKTMTMNEKGVLNCDVSQSWNVFYIFLKDFLQVSYRSQRRQRWNSIWPAGTTQEEFVFSELVVCKGKINSEPFRNSGNLQDIARNRNIWVGKLRVRQSSWRTLSNTDNWVSKNKGNYKLRKLLGILTVPKQMIFNTLWKEREDQTHV